MGASYEFIKCYNEEKRPNEDEDEDGVMKYDIETQAQVNYLNQLSNAGKNNNGTQKQNTIDVEKEKKTKCRKNKIIVLLIILGVFVQPFYLLFKSIELLMECYRRYGCWFYYFGSY